MADLQIGKLYTVPAIQVKNWGGFTGFVPVIGPEHEDTEIVRFPWEHWHVDWRFAPRRVFDDIVNDRPNSPFPGYAYARVVMRHSTTGEQLAFGEPIPKRMTYKRALPAYPHERAVWCRELAAKYACAKLVNGKCPHRGIPVSAMLRDGEILTCPGHGLRWNALTGEAVPQP